MASDTPQHTKTKAGDHGLNRVGDAIVIRLQFASETASRAVGEAQGCISLTSGASELACGPRSVTSASKTVRTMNTADAPNTPCGKFWSMIQPNSSGLT